MKRNLVIAFLVFVFVVFVGCESKPEVQVPDGGFPPPSISAAPGSKTTPPPETEAEPPAEAPAKKRRSSSRRGGMGGSNLGTSGKSGGGGVADGMDGLLEAEAPARWTVRMLEPDPSVEVETKKLIERQLPSFQRCLSFVKDGNRIRFAVRFEGSSPRSVTASPANDTAAECVRTQLGRVRFPAPPKELSFEFRR